MKFDITFTVCMVETLSVCFRSAPNGISIDRLIKWNNNNNFSIILNVDGSCLGSAIRVGYGGVLRNETSFYLSGFFGYIQHSSDILKI